MDPKYTPDVLPDVPNLLHVVLLGSHASHTAIEASDADIYGFYVDDLGPTDPVRTVGMNRHGVRVEVRLYDIKLVLRLLGEADPNIHAMLWATEDFWIYTTKAAKVLIDVRQDLLVSAQPAAYLAAARSMLVDAALRMQALDGMQVAEEYRPIMLRVARKKLYHAQRLTDQALSVAKRRIIDIQANRAKYLSIRSGDLGPDHIRLAIRAAEEEIESNPFVTKTTDQTEVLHRVLGAVEERIL